MIWIAEALSNGGEVVKSTESSLTDFHAHEPRRINVSTPTSRPLRFLDLPLEIRDEIYEYVLAPDLSDCSGCPPRVQGPNPRSYIRVFLDTCISADHEAKITWQPIRKSKRRTNPLNLFLSSKQIYVESARVLYSTTAVEITHLDSCDAETLSQSIAAACPFLQRYSRRVSILGSAQAAENEVMVQVLLSFWKLQEVQVRYDLSCSLHSQIAVDMGSFMPLQMKHIKVELKGEKGLCIRGAEDVVVEDDVEFTWLEKGREGIFIGLILLICLVRETAADLMEQIYFYWDL